MREIRSERRLSDMVYTEIKKAIINGDIKLGERLTLKYLAESLKVSKTPIREALNKLEKEGFVINIPNRGVEVIKFDFKDITDICDFRLIIEREAFKLMCERDNDYKRIAEELQLFIVQMDKSYQEENYVKYKEWDTKFHRYFSIKAGNKYLLQVQKSNEVKDLLVVANHIERIPMKRKLGIDEHWSIVTELKKCRPESAQKALVNHLMRVRNDILSNLNLNMERAIK